MPAGRVQQLIALLRDVTAEVQQQQKLDALHQAGRELAALDAEQLADMGVEERIELLKHNIRRLTHDLLHYDVIEIRLLDQDRPAGAAAGGGHDARGGPPRLYASDEGNGVTGFVAATGKSYLCPDTADRPALHRRRRGRAHSSLTVP